MALPRAFIPSLQWRPGDFIISDNLALGHEAAPETQLPPEQARPPSHWALVMQLHGHAASLLASQRCRGSQALAANHVAGDLKP